MTVTRRYMGVRDAAEHLGITEGALRQKVQRREIPFIKDGKRLRFDIRDIDAHMRARRVEATR